MASGASRSLPQDPAVLRAVKYVFLTYAMIVLVCGAISFGRFSRTISSATKAPCATAGAFLSPELDTTPTRRVRWQRHEWIEIMGASEIITYRGYALTVVRSLRQCTVNISMFNKPGLASSRLQAETKPSNGQRSG
jgi:hypothetical protein